MLKSSKIKTYNLTKVITTVTGGWTAVGASKPGIYSQTINAPAGYKPGIFTGSETNVAEIRFYSGTFVGVMTEIFPNWTVPSLPASAILVYVSESVTTQNLYIHWG